MTQHPDNLGKGQADPAALALAALINAELEKEHMETPPEGIQDRQLDSTDF